MKPTGTARVRVRVWLKTALEVAQDSQIRKRFKSDPAVNHASGLASLVSCFRGYRWGCWRSLGLNPRVVDFSDFVWTDMAAGSRGRKTLAERV